MTIGKTAAVVLLASYFLPNDTQAAVPAALTHQGRLLDAAGQPVTTNQIFVYKIYDDPTAGTVLWTETVTVPLDQGHFSVQLGLTAPIPDSLLTAGPRYLGIQVGADAEMTPREQLSSVPYARVAGEVSGDIHPNSVSVAGAPVISSAGRWVGPVPVAVGACMPVAGPCGAGTTGQGLEFLDRVVGNCPATYPVLSGVRFVRCGSDGLLLSMTCCALQLSP